MGPKTWMAWELIKALASVVAMAPISLRHGSAAASRIRLPTILTYKGIFESLDTSCTAYGAGAPRGTSFLEVIRQLDSWNTANVP